MGGGVNVLYFVSGTTAPDVAGIRAAYTLLGAHLGTTLSIQVPGGGDRLEDSTGVLIAGWTATQPAVITGSSSNACAAGVGACVTWNTGQVVAGHRLRGRSFLVPLNVGSYDDSGTLSSSALGSITSFATAMLALDLGVWHRPSVPGTSSDGVAHAAQSFNIRDKVAILTSRRD